MRSEPRRAAMAQLEQSLTLMVRTMGGRPARSPDDGLSVPQRLVVGWLAAAGKQRISDIADRMGVSLSAATGLADRLARAGLAIRERSTEDRRVVWLEITPKGRELLAQTHAHRRQQMDEAFSVLSDEDLAEFARLVGKVVTSQRKEPSPE
ncbi:MAG: MarR family winged helix-turn-helix transcriptional regulator [Bacillota bacterium]